jgi:hypothetical protein
MCAPPSIVTTLVCGSRRRSRPTARGNTGSLSDPCRQVTGQPMLDTTLDDGNGHVVRPRGSAAWAAQRWGLTGRAEFVPKDHSCERRQFIVEARICRSGPHQIHMGDPARNDHQVQRGRHRRPDRRCLPQGPSRSASPAYGPSRSVSHPTTWSMSSWTISATHSGIAHDRV